MSGLWWTVVGGVYVVGILANGEMQPFTLPFSTLIARALTWPIPAARAVVRGIPTFVRGIAPFIKLVWKEAWR